MFTCAVASAVGIKVGGGSSPFGCGVSGCVATGSVSGVVVSLSTSDSLSFDVLSELGVAVRCSRASCRTMLVNATLAADCLAAVFDGCESEKYWHSSAITAAVCESCSAFVVYSVTFTGALGCSNGAVCSTMRSRVSSLVM